MNKNALLKTIRTSYLLCLVTISLTAHAQNVGIGTNNPLGFFSVGTGSPFQINSSGNIVKINGIIYSWPTAQGMNNYALTDNGLGTLKWTKISITPPGTNEQLIFNDNGAFGAASAVWNKSLNYLGIGTTIPQNPLDVEGSIPSGFTAFILNNMGSGTALDAVNLSGDSGKPGSGLVALTQQSVGFAIKAYNLNLAGTGIFANGNGVIGYYPTAGSGGAFNGTTLGIVGIGINSTTGTGIAGYGNGLFSPSSNDAFVLTSGSGVTGGGSPIGVWGYTPSTGNNCAGGFFSFGATAGGGNVGFAYIATMSALVQWKVLGTGSVGTVVEDTHNKLVSMACPEAPEILFEDVGEGQLVNGKAHITLDPIFCKNIIVNDKHPLRPFVQPQGNTNGVYTTNETASGFDVVENNKGTDTVPFHWQVIANRADEYQEGKLISKNADFRFGAGPSPLPMSQQKIATVKKENFLKKLHL